MKKHFLIFLSILCLQVFSQSNELLQNAEKAYDSKQYKEAVNHYEELIDKGFKSYQLYFNLGNAYYRNEQLGKAIYYFELARKLEPGDEDVKVNLAIASSKTIDKIDSKENFFISAVKTNILSSLSTKTWAILSIVFIFNAAVLFYLFVSARTSNLKRTAFLFFSLFLVASASSYLLGYSALLSKNANKFAIVFNHEIKVMNEPTHSANIKFSLHEGTKVKVVENNGDWLLIKLENGNEGWIKVTEVGLL